MTPGGAERKPKTISAEAGHVATLAVTALLVAGDTFLAGCSGVQQLPAGSRLLATIPTDHEPQLFWIEETLGQYKTWSPTWSTDGQFVAYSAQNEVGNFVVLQGKRANPVNRGTIRPELIVSANANTVVYTSLVHVPDLGSNATVVGVNGAVSEPFPTGEMWVALTAGGAVAYAMNLAGDSGIVGVGRHVAPMEFGEVKPPVAVSADGNRLAVVVRFNGISAICLGSRAPIAPAGAKEGIRLAVFQGKEMFGNGSGYRWALMLPRSEPYEDEALPTFSPDGSILAHAAKRDGKWFIVGRVARSPFDEIGSIAFSPDSKQLAYTAREGSDWYVVRDSGERIGPFDRIRDIVFSPDGTSVAIAATKGGRAFVVAGSWKSEPYDRVWKPVFRGKHLAFAASENGQHRIVVGQQKSALFDEVDYARFSEDGATVSFGARKDRALLLASFKIQ
jgi:hypothetical protein